MKTCLLMIRFLADMSSLGMNVVAVIHQPRYSSFSLFDQVGWECASFVRMHKYIRALHLDQTGSLAASFSCRLIDLAGAPSDQTVIPYVSHQTVSLYVRVHACII